MIGKELLRLGDICHEIKATTKDPISDGFERYIGMEHLDSGSLKIRRWGMVAEDKPKFTRIFRKGQILFGKRRPYLRKAAVAEFDGVCSGDIVVIDMNESSPDCNMLLLILQSEPFWDWAVRTSRGSLSPRTNFKDIANFEFPKLHCSKAKSVVDIVRQAVWAIQASDDALASAKQVFHALLLELLSPKENWLKMSLKDIAEVKGGRQRSPKHQHGRHMVPYLRPANIKRGRLRLKDVLEMNFTPEEQKVYTLKSGDILLVEGGEAEDVGDSAYWNLDGRYCYQNTLIRVRAKEAVIKPRHLFWILTYLHRSGGLLRLAAGTKIKHIGTESTSKLQVSIPPVKDMGDICSVLDAVESCIGELETSNRRLKGLNKSIVRELYQ